MHSSHKPLNLLNKTFCIPKNHEQNHDKCVTSDPECIKMRWHHVKLRFWLKNWDRTWCFTAAVCSDRAGEVSSGCSRLVLPSRSDPAASNSLQGNQWEIHEADGECDRHVETQTYEQNVSLEAAIQRLLIVALDFFYQLKVERVSAVESFRYTFLHLAVRSQQQALVSDRFCPKVLHSSLKLMHLPTS